MVSLGEGFRVWFRGVAGVAFLWKTRAKGKRVKRVGDGAGKGISKLGVLSHHLKCGMKSPQLVDFS